MIKTIETAVEIENSDIQLPEEASRGENSPYYFELPRKERELIDDWWRTSNSDFCSF